jgi:hypothetical protein
MPKTTVPVDWKSSQPPPTASDIVSVANQLSHLVREITLLAQSLAQMQAALLDVHYRLTTRRN